MYRVEDRVIHKLDDSNYIRKDFLAIGLKEVIFGNTDKYRYSDGHKCIHGNISRYRRQPGVIIMSGKDVDHRVSEFDTPSTRKNIIFEFEQLIKNDLKKQNTLEFEDFVIITKERYEKLITFEEAIEEAVDSLMCETVLERQDEPTDIELSEVINELNLDAEEILKLIDEVEEEY